MAVNNTFNPYQNIMLKEFTIELNGKMNPGNAQLIYLSSSSVQPFFSVEDQIEALRRKGGGFLQLQLIDEKQKVLSENLYWISDTDGHYSGLCKMPNANVILKATRFSDRSIQVSITNPSGNPVAFFIRLSVVDPAIGKRILPMFYDNNYLSVLPGETREVHISSEKPFGKYALQISGWNVKEQTVPLSSGN
jgi:hypothetical protein